MRAIQYGNIWYMLRSAFALLCGQPRETMFFLLSYTYVPHGISCAGWHYRMTLLTIGSLNLISAPVFFHSGPLKWYCTTYPFTVMQYLRLWVANLLGAFGQTRSEGGGVSRPRRSLRYRSWLWRTCFSSPINAFIECIFVSPGKLRVGFTSGGCSGLGESYTAWGHNLKQSWTVLQWNIHHACKRA